MPRISDKSYCLPEYNEVRESMITRSQDFIADVSGCSYSFQIVKADGSPQPNYFDVASNGGITFVNRANNKISEYFKVVISAVDGYGNVETYNTDPFQVKSECCIGSTTVRPPVA